jgi:hypothetical protein
MQLHMETARKLYSCGDQDNEGREGNTWRKTQKEERTDSQANSTL